VSAEVGRGGGGERLKRRGKDRISRDRQRMYEDRLLRSTSEFIDNQVNANRWCV